MLLWIIKASNFIEYKLSTYVVILHYILQYANICKYKMCFVVVRQEKEKENEAKATFKLTTTNLHYHNFNVIYMQIRAIMKITIRNWKSIKMKKLFPNKLSTKNDGK